MSFGAFDAWWWPFLFILAAGWLPTDCWRALGVFLGGRLSEDAEILVLVRSMATALVAAVISSLIVFPAGPLADTSLALRIGASVAGFVAYLAARKRVIVGILAGEAVLMAGMLLA